jgi:hypothetical protein
MLPRPLRPAPVWDGSPLFRSARRISTAAAQQPDTGRTGARSSRPRTVAEARPVKPGEGPESRWSAKIPRSHQQLFAQAIEAWNRRKKMSSVVSNPSGRVQGWHDCPFASSAEHWNDGRNGLMESSCPEFFSSSGPIRPAQLIPVQVWSPCRRPVVRGNHCRLGYFWRVSFTKKVPARWVISSVTCRSCAPFRMKTPLASRSPYLASTT